MALRAAVRNDHGVDDAVVGDGELGRARLRQLLPLGARVVGRGGAAAQARGAATAWRGGRGTWVS